MFFFSMLDIIIRRSKTKIPTNDNNGYYHHHYHSLQVPKLCPPPSPAHLSEHISLLPDPHTPAVSSNLPQGFGPSHCLCLEHCPQMTTSFTPSLHSSFHSNVTSLETSKPDHTVYGSSPTPPSVYYPHDPDFFFIRALTNNSNIQIS